MSLVEGKVTAQISISSKDHFIRWGCVDKEASFFVETSRRDLVIDEDYFLIVLISPINSS